MNVNTMSWRATIGERSHPFDIIDAEILAFMS